jgi:hypothetical protein
MQKPFIPREYDYELHPKRALFDWFSYTFDDIEFYQHFDKINNRTIYSLVPGGNNHKIMTALFSLFGIFEDWYTYPRLNYGLNGYQFTFQIGENISIQFGGPCSGRGRPTSQILMTGQGCHEFREYMNGNFAVLFEFCLQNFRGRCTNLHLAMDDFAGNEIRDLRELYPLVIKRSYRTRFVKKTIIENYDDSIQNEFDFFSTGYSLTFGSPGNTQFQMYDKLAQLHAMGIDYSDTNIWNRYEMRFRDERADAVMMQYILSSKNNSESFYHFSASCMNNLIEFKDETSPNESVRHRPIHPKWEALLESFSKIELDLNFKAPLTIERKKNWYAESIHGVNASFLLTTDDIDSYMIEHYSNLLSGLKDFDIEKLKPVNKYRLEHGLSPLSLQQAKERITNIEFQRKRLQKLRELDLIFDDQQQLK